MAPEGTKYSSDLGQNRAPLVQNEGLHERHGRQTAPLSYWTKAYYPASSEEDTMRPVCGSLFG
ncbi:hypothetical protein ANTHELSMS3_02414 [Antarctobacter heliothermus]|uniref:Uncharacterized protein n=1 Tax=Antarctobacter heliothermus TaxID=74033 RepID=A0A222E1B3_9RHOB|nr:hypothetical protein ANTHELSMS3_01301 [Antarctobacter heliothermus]ASP21084.1 hypothetical protein ANTHELSMS3_02414 [Antarctobacter heliothermus]